MNFEDTSDAPSTMKTVLHTLFTETMLTAMAAEDGKLLRHFLKERGLDLQTLQSNERILGQEVTTGKHRKTSAPELPTGIGLFVMVLDILEERGFTSGGSVTIKLNDIGLDIQEITLSFPFSTEKLSPATSGERTQSILTHLTQSIRDQQGRECCATDQHQTPGQ